MKSSKLKEKCSSPLSRCNDNQTTTTDRTNQLTANDDQSLRFKSIISRRKFSTKNAPAFCLKSTVENILKVVNARKGFDTSTCEFGEEETVTTPHSFTETGIKFNIEYFRSKKFSQLPIKCREVCLKITKFRTPDEIRTLRSVCANTLLGFSLFPIKLQEALCRVMRYERFGRRRVIVRKTHPATSMYFIFYGAVGISTDYDGSSLFNAIDPMVLSRGKSFGEYALLMKTKRNATVACMEDTEFLVIDREDFFELGLDEFLIKEYSARINYFKAQPVLAKVLKPCHVGLIASETKSELHSINNVIHLNTFNSNYSYFIQQGIVDVYRLVNLVQCQSFAKYANKGLFARANYPEICCEKDHYIYVRVKRLKTSDYYLHDPLHEKRGFVLVSMGATIIRVHFDELKKYEIFDELVSKQNKILSDDQITVQFMEGNEWRYFKQAVLSETMERVSQKKRGKFWKRNIDAAKKCGSRGSVGNDKPEKEGVIYLRPECNRHDKYKNSQKQNLIHQIHLPYFDTAWSYSYIY